MIPKEEAKELRDSFLKLEIVLFDHDGDAFTFPCGRITEESARACALLTVNKILEIRNTIDSLPESETKMKMMMYVKYYEQVKKQLSDGAADTE